MTGEVRVIISHNSTVLWFPQFYRVRGWTDDGVDEVPYYDADPHRGHRTHSREGEVIVFASFLSVLRSAVHSRESVRRPVRPIPSFFVPVFLRHANGRVVAT